MTQGPKSQLRRTDSASHRPARRWRSSFVSLGIAAVVVLGLVTMIHAIAANGSGGTSSNAGSNTTGDVTPAGPAARTAAPVFTLTTLSGTTFSLANARGHAVVLYFMATTCGTCVQGSQDLAQAVQSAHVTGAQAVAIDVNPGDTTSDLASFAQATGVPATASVLWGVDTRGSIAQAYGVQTLETTVVLDSQGRIAYEHPGPVAPQQLAQLIQKAG